MTLLTLLDDYWFGRQVHIPSAALVELLGEFGIGEQAARAALSRVQRTGMLEGVKQGRRTAYRLSDGAAEAALVQGRRILRFSAETPSSALPWDGRWTIIAYSLAADRADDRRRIRRRLRALGLAPLQDALWLSPRPVADRVQRVLDSTEAVRLNIFEQAVLVGEAAPDVVDAWRLDELRRRYDEVLEQFAATIERLEAIEAEPDEAFVTRVETMDTWRPMRRLDPQLPAELLPQDWPGWEARRRFAEIHDRLGEPATARVKEIVARHSDDAADAVWFDTVADPR